MEMVLSWLFILSRVVFINPGNVFFDSKEYLMRWSNPNLWQALTMGHTPLHDGYILTYWPIYQLASKFTIIPEYVVMLVQVLIAYGTVYFFYKTTALLFSKRTAFFSAGLLSLMPLFWVTNVSIMMETTYLFYWMAATYFLIVYLKARSRGIYLVLASGLWLMAFLTHSVVMLWIPLVMYLNWMVNKKKMASVLAGGLLALAGASFLNAYWLSAASHQSIWYGFYELFLSKYQEHAQVSADLMSVLRFMRNWIVPTLYNNNGLLVLVSLVGFFGILKKNRQQAVLFAWWILPTMVTNQWWDSLFFGRHALISIFAMAILGSFMVRRWRYFLLVLYLGFGSISALSLLKQDIPYLAISEKFQTLIPGGFLIESHFARPQTNGEYHGEIFFVGEPGYDEKQLPVKINDYLSRNKLVYITGQALSEPYGLFNGPYLHSLTLSYKDPFLLKEILNNYGFSIQTEVDVSNNLAVYRLNATKGEYPAIKALIDSPKRLDNHDPVSWYIVNLFTRRK